MVDLCIVMLVYQRVSHLWYPKRLSKATPVLHTVPFVFLWGNWLEWVQNSKKIMGFKPTVDFLHLGTDRNRNNVVVASSTCPKPGAVQSVLLFFLDENSNVGKTMSCLPSTSHHHFYRWYKPFPNGWFMIVFLTLIGYAMAPCFFAYRTRCWFDASVCGVSHLWCSL